MSLYSICTICVLNIPYSLNLYNLFTLHIVPSQYVQYMYSKYRTVSISTICTLHTMLTQSVIYVLYVLYWPDIFDLCTLRTVLEGSFWKSFSWRHVLWVLLRSIKIPSKKLNYLTDQPTLFNFKLSTWNNYMPESYYLCLGKNNVLVFYFWKMRFLHKSESIR